MKFGRDYDASLSKGEYPQEWVDSAISYKQLKKCIKKVQIELQSLGLDSKTLEVLWQQVHEPSSFGGEDDSSLPRPYQYSFSDDIKRFQPILTVAVDPRSCSPVDAWLSPRTREFLKGLAKRQHTEGTASDTPNGIVKGTLSNVLSEADGDLDLLREECAERVVTVEVPLTSDSEFFQILKRELRNLERLQETQQNQFQIEIVKLGEKLNTISRSSSKKSKAEVQAWREIFRLYVESQIFFSAKEEDAGARDSRQAQNQLDAFSKSLTQAQQKTLRLDKNSATALERFMQINVGLLQFLKFQEINRTALTKIMKKFDKRTALHAQDEMPMILTKTPFVAQDLAKATCFTISEELLRLIPQLDDYLCPVCFSISFKPIRLRCRHVFCIRCLIVMQRAEQDHCPLCRGNVVLEATGEQLDAELMAFLKRKFPIEVKAKQKENEYAAAVDRFGVGYDEIKCSVM